MFAQRKPRHIASWSRQARHELPPDWIARRGKHDRDGTRVLLENRHYPSPCGDNNIWSGNDEFGYGGSHPAHTACGPAFVGLDVHADIPAKSLEFLTEDCNSVLHLCIGLG